MANTLPPAPRRKHRAVFGAALLLGLLADEGRARAQAHRAAPPTAVRDIRVVDREDAPRVTLVLREGRIDQVLDVGEPVPPGCWVVEGEGRLAVPAFVDAYAQAGVETPEPVADQDLPTDVSADVDVDMRVANRKGIQPSFRAADALALAEKDAEKWREQGFGALLAAPHGELLAGTSVLAVTREAAPRDAVVHAEVFAHAAFAASGSGYPGTLMGYMAQLRQFFLDARRQVQLQRRFEDGRPGPRPPYDPELGAAVELLAGERRVLCEAQNARDIRRWIQLGTEAGFDIGIAGGRDAWKVADVLAERRIPVVLTLDWGDEVKDPHAKKKGKAAKGEPESGGAEMSAGAEAAAEDADEAAEEAVAGDAIDWVYEEPLGVREERRRLWEEGRDTALRLNEAGVAFVFGSGDAGPKKLVERVRKLVENGLPRDAALQALTRGSAELCGAGRRLGSLAPGFDASFALWTEHPLAEKAKLAHLFVDGFHHEFDLDEEAEFEGEPDEGVDATGTWLFSVKSPMRTTEVTAELAMEPEGPVTGTFTSESPEGGSITGDLVGHVAGRTLKLRFEYAVGEMQIEMALEGELQDDAFEGTGTAKASFGEFDLEVTGAREPREESGR